MGDQTMPSYENIRSQFKEAIGSSFTLAEEDKTAVTVILKEVKESTKNPDRKDMKTFSALFTGPKDETYEPLNGEFKNDVLGVRLMLLTPVHDEAEQTYYEAIINMKTASQ